LRVPRHLIKRVALAWDVGLIKVAFRSLDREFILERHRDRLQAALT
jgi:hypothetical protein